MISWYKSSTNSRFSEPAFDRKPARDFFSMAGIVFSKLAFSSWKKLEIMFHTSGRKFMEHQLGIEGGWKHEEEGRWTTSSLFESFMKVDT